MVSSDEIKRRLEAKRKGIEYQERVGRGSNNAKECPYCNTINPSTAKFCVGCGKKLETPEPETGFKPDIRGSETSEIKEPEAKKGTTRPDDFSNTSKQRIKTKEPEDHPEESTEGVSEKLEPIVPPTPETEETPTSTVPEAEPVQETSPEPPQVKQTIPEVVTPKTEPEILTPETKTEPEKITSKSQTESDVDPVERIKKAKELLDIGAITQEEFDMIKNKYLNLL